VPDWLRQLDSARGKIPEWAHALVFFGAGILCLFFLDDTWVRMLFLVTLYATLGMGLNVVVGLAGLLDLGFVAFFAAGAYVVAIWGAPISPAVSGTMNYWLLLPMAVLVGAGIGLLLGLPVLPLRGDYLAIVTLGFGEIIRILALNMDNVTRGSSGLFGINKPDYGFGKVDHVDEFFVMVLIAAMVVWFVTSRLRDSRVGRAWEAIREDEDVAAAMGIDTTRYKLMAFATGAAVGALGGAIYAPFVDFVAPQSFSLIVSINVLALVIIGGMGNTTGVIAGSAILIGVPEVLQFEETSRLLSHLSWLRDGGNTLIDAFNAVTTLDVSKLPPASEWGDKLALYRFIVFGALLVIVMVLRPSGLFPSRRRQLEFQVEPAEPLVGDA
jgi:branched-chain amino acid transport system permease protein